MAKRKSVNFLPQVFNTLSNKRFLNATMDPLIQEPSLKKMYGYINKIKALFILLVIIILTKAIVTVSSIN